MSRQKKLTRPVAGFDCAAIAPTTYHPERYKRLDAYGWAVHIGPGCTNEHDVRWFLAARSQADCLRVAYGPSWHISFLGQMGEAHSCDADAMQFYLLTHQVTGWRLIVRLPVARDGDEWASSPDIPRGRIAPTHQTAQTKQTSRPTTVGDDAAAAADEEARETAQARRTWLADALKGNVLAGAGLYHLLTEVERYSVKPTHAEALAQARLRTPGHLDPPAPAWAWDEQVAAGLRAVLTEVWLAEKGLTGQDAEAMRVMCALAGWQAIHSYASDERAAALDAHPVA